MYGKIRERERASDSLTHYGVVGMKWGQRRARKQGNTYKYRSSDTKNFERASKQYGKKKDKAIVEFYRNKNAYEVNPPSAEKQIRKINKYAGKQENYRVLAKASSKFDKRFQDTVDKEFKGKKGAVKYAALGPIGSKRYSEIMSDNSKKVKRGRAYAAAVVSQLGGALGAAASYALAPSGRDNYLIRESERIVRRKVKKKRTGASFI